MMGPMWRIRIAGASARGRMTGIGLDLACIKDICLAAFTSHIDPGEASGGQFYRNSALMSEGRYLGFESAG